MRQPQKKIKNNLELAEKIFTVVNPISANGKTGRRWPELADYFTKQGIELQSALTEYPEHAVSIVRNALQRGYRSIMSVGGDGTINEVINGFFKDGHLINPEAKLIVFSRGTGSDFIKSLGINNSCEEINEIIRKGKEFLVDVGQVSFRKDNGDMVKRFFINLSDAGIGGETVAYVNQASKFFGGLITYLIGALKTLIFYNNKKFKLIIDGKKVLEKKINSIMVANGGYFGGGMNIAPGSVLNDGLFNIVVLGNVNKMEIITNLYKAYSGTHLSHPKVKTFQGKEIIIASEEKVRLNVDGESVGLLPARFTILPEKLPVMVI